MILFEGTLYPYATLWVTELDAICPYTDRGIVKFCGPEVPGYTIEDAQHYCNTNGLGYLRVLGPLLSEIPCKPGTYEADFDKMIDYEKPPEN
jgi:hypothetical protein